MKGLDHQTHRPSPHHTRAEINFLHLGGRALSEGRHTASQWQDFYRENRHLEFKCVAYCNCRDVDPKTDFKRVLSKKDRYPDPPDPVIPDEYVTPIKCFVFLELNLAVDQPKQITAVRCNHIMQI